jgi:malonyl-ACP decarboxylase
MERPGRQSPDGSTAFLGAEIGALRLPESIPKQVLRTASFSAQVAITTLFEAWDDAKLDAVDPLRIGLVIGGTNFQQKEVCQTHDAYRDGLWFLRPSYGMSFMDSDLCGLCTELLAIRAFAYTLGGASASSQLALIQAIQAVQSGQVDACIAMGALMDLSYW